MARAQKHGGTEAVVASAEPRKPLFERLAGYLDANDWHYESVAEKGYIDMRATIRDTSVRVVLDTFEADDWQRIVVYSFYAVRAPENRRAAILDAINRINFRLVFGNIEMDGQDGELRIRTVVESDGEIPEPMMERALHSNLNTANRNFAPLMAVAFGNADPATVLDLEARTNVSTVQ